MRLNLANLAKLLDKQCLLNIVENLNWKSQLEISTIVLKALALKFLKFKRPLLKRTPKSLKESFSFTCGLLLNSCSLASY